MAGILLLYVFFSDSDFDSWLYFYVPVGCVMMVDLITLVISSCCFSANMRNFYFLESITHS